MLGYGDDIYEILGIDRNADTRTIKKAYARLVKQYHPEENPKEWERIHDAYELAIRFASGRTKRSRMISGSSEYGSLKQELPQDSIVPIGAPECGYQAPHQIQTLSAERRNEPEDVFGSLEQIISKQRENEKKAKREKWEDVGKAIQEMKRLAARKNFDLKEWEALFGTDDLQKREKLPVLSQSKFLQTLGDCFTLYKIDNELYDFLKDELNRISNYMERYMIDQDGMDMASLSYAKTSIDMAYRETLSPKSPKRMVYAGIAVILSVILVLSLLYVNSGPYMDWSNSRESSRQTGQESGEMSLEERLREEYRWTPDSNIPKETYDIWFYYIHMKELEEQQEETEGDYVEY